MEENLIETVKEGQMKLGYSDAAVRLNYRIASLERFLEVNWKDTAEMEADLLKFCSFSEKKLGQIGIQVQSNGMVCLTVPKEGAAYVHENIPDDPFKMELFSLLKTFGAAKEDFLSLFTKYWDEVECLPGDEIEYDFALHFKGKADDDNYYCIKIDFGRATYHRLSAEDFEKML